MNFYFLSLIFETFKDGCQLSNSKQKNNVLDLFILYLHPPADKMCLIFMQFSYYQPSASTLRQISTVIIAEKEIIALSSGPEAVSANSSYDPHHPNQPRFISIIQVGSHQYNPSILNQIISLVLLKVKAGQRQQTKLSVVFKPFVKPGQFRSKLCHDQTRTTRGGQRQQVTLHAKQPSCSSIVRI